jgi:erythromycin esterase
MISKWCRAAILVLLCFLPLSLVGCLSDAPEITAEDVDIATVIAWVEEEAFPLETTELVDDTSDLEWLREAVGDARIVGLGDQTNGTKESITLSNRVIDFLLREMEFSVIATTSCSWGHSLTTDRYISEGKGRSRGAREAFVPPFDLSVTILDFLVWARRFKVHQPEVPLHLLGVNPLSPHQSFEWCKNILLGAGCTFPQATLRMIERLEYVYSKMWGDQDEQSKYFAQASELMDKIQELLPDYEDKLSEWERSIIERIPRSLAQLEEYLLIANDESEPNDAGWRQQAFDFYNQCTAENMSWWLNTLGEDAKVIICGHNSEIAKHWAEADVTPLGQRLSESYGKNYVSFGFSAGGGIVYALQREGGDFLGYGPGVVPEPIQDSYESVLCNTSFTDYALDLRSLSPDSDIAIWMNESRPFKVLGDNLHTTHRFLDTAYNTFHTLPRMFDVLLHVQFTRGLDRAY